MLACAQMKWERLVRTPVYLDYDRVSTNFSSIIKYISIIASLVYGSVLEIYSIDHQNLPSRPPMLTFWRRIFFSNFSTSCI